MREAACACIAELGSKMNKDCLRPYVPQLVSTLIDCFKDDSWPVRDCELIVPSHPFHFVLLSLVHNIHKAMRRVAARNWKSIQNNLGARRDATQRSNRLRVYIRASRCTSKSFCMDFRLCAATRRTALRIL